MNPALDQMLPSPDRAYDVYGRPLVRTVPKDQAGGVLITTPAPVYDANDNVTKATGPNGAVSTAVYDSADQVGTGELLCSEEVALPLQFVHQFAPRHFRSAPHRPVLSRHRRDEARLSEAATAALAVVGLEQLASVRSDRLQHSELRFVEIARALMLRPSFLLLDEPAAGLSVDEIKRLGALIATVSQRGTGVLLVEHHADLIFDICDRVTVLNLGKVLASGTPSEIRAHREVINAYLGA